MGRAARPRRAPAHRGAARQRGRVPVLARRRGDQPLDDRRHQRDLPRRGARAARRPHRLPGAGHVRHVRPPCSTTRRTRCPRDRVLRTHTPSTHERSPASTADREWAPASDDDLFLLIFTSGSTGFPKAVRCTQGRFARTGAHVAEHRRARARATAVYAPLPFFHSSSLFTGWSPARCTRGAAIGTRSAVLGVAHHARHPAHGRRRCSPTRARSSTTSSRCRPSPDDADVAAASSRSATRRRSTTSASSPARFDCHGARQLRLDRGHDHHPPRRVDAARRARLRRRHDQGVRSRHRAGVPARGVRRTAGGSRTSTPQWARSSNTAPATASRATTATRRPASKVRDGVYWSGDLAYRDADGWFFFAGRSNEWLRVDGENFAAGPVEAIVLPPPERALGGGVRGARRPGRRPGDGGDRGRRRRRLRRRRRSTRSSRSSPTSGRSGSRASCASRPSCRSSRA